MIQGEIFKLKKEFKSFYKKNFYIHPFIFWESHELDCKGIMLTTSNDSKYNNIRLKKTHFLSNYDLIFGKSDLKPTSFIVPLYLLKDVKYEHLLKVGELSGEGKIFISEKVKELQYTDWASYLENCNKVIKY